MPAVFTFLAMIEPKYSDSSEYQNNSSAIGNISGAKRPNKVAKGDPLQRQDLEPKAACAESLNAAMSPVIEQHILL